jgi:hypothetical protein
MNGDLHGNEIPTSKFYCEHVGGRAQYHKITANSYAEGEIRTPEPLQDEALNLTPLSARQPPPAMLLC